MNEKEYTVNAVDKASARAEARRWSGGRVVSCEVHTEQLPNDRVSLVAGSTDDAALDTAQWDKGAPHDRQTR